MGFALGFQRVCLFLRWSSPTDNPKTSTHPQGFFGANQAEGANHRKIQQDTKKVAKTQAGFEPVLTKKIRFRCRALDNLATKTIEI